MEVVVVALCLFVLLAVFTPRVQQVREITRRVQCTDVMMGLSLATYNYAATYGGSLPPLEDGQHGWPILVLPMVDQNPLSQQIRAGGDRAAWPRVSVPQFQCPNDPDSFRQPGGLSYAVNAGYGDFHADPRTGAITEIGVHSAATDRDGDGQVTIADVRLNLATGVFWRPVSLEGYAPTGWTLDAIEAADGMASTLLLAENANAGPWYSRRTADLGFVIGREVLRFADGPSAVGPLQLAPTIDLGMYAPARSAAEVSRRSPVPGSHHSGIVHVAFCDGRATSLSDQIDPAIYARLMTPAGEQYGQLPVNPAAY